MSDEQLPSAGYYREMARKISELAIKSQIPDVRRDLVELAERFARMAAYVERRHPNGRGKSAPKTRAGDT